MSESVNEVNKNATIQNCSPNYFNRDYLPRLRQKLNSDSQIFWSFHAKLSLAVLFDYKFYFKKGADSDLGAGQEYASSIIRGSMYYAANRAILYVKSRPATF